MRGAAAGAAALALLLAAAVAAPAGDGWPRLEEPGYSLLVRQTWTDNLFSEEEESARVSDTFTTLDVRAERTRRFRSGWRLTPEARFKGIVYGETEDASHVEGTAGAEWRKGPTRFEVSFLHSPSRLSFFQDDGDAVTYEKSDWRFRIRHQLDRRARLEGRFGYLERDYSGDQEKRSRVGRRWTGAIAFEILPAFNPRIGFTYVDYDARNNNYSRVRRRLELYVEGKVAPRLAYRLEMRWRESEYRGDDPDGSNYGREDERDDYALELRVELREGASLRFGGKRTLNESTKEGRDYGAWEQWVGLLWEF
jgi:hypothetical protein